MDPKPEKGEDTLDQDQAVASNFTSTLQDNELQVTNIRGTKVPGKFDINLYATKKSAANGLLDIALLMANAAQLKHVLISEHHQFYILMLSLLLTSIILQVGLGVALLMLARMRVTDGPLNDYDAKRIRSAEKLNNWVVSGVFVLTVINVFISAFGLNEKPKASSPTLYHQSTGG